MARDTMSAVVGAHNIPAAIRSLDTLTNPDYADMFTAITSRATDKSPEQWARAVLEDAPLARRFAFIPWRVLLGLRLGPGHSPDYVHGWKIADRGDSWVRVEAASWFMTAHAVVHIDEGRLCGALFVRYDRPVAALVWPPISIIHRQAMPVILRQALRAHSATRTEVRP
jgi:hypothetical protein